MEFRFFLLSMLLFRTKVLSEPQAGAQSGPDGGRSWSRRPDQISQKNRWFWIGPQDPLPGVLVKLFRMLVSCGTAIGRKAVEIAGK